MVVAIGVAAVLVVAGAVVAGVAVVVGEAGGIAGIRGEGRPAPSDVLSDRA